MANSPKNLVRTSIILCTVLFFITACKNRKNDGSSGDLTVITQQTTTKVPVQVKDAEVRHPFAFDSYEEKKQFNLKNYVVSIQLGYYFADSARDPHARYDESNLLVARNKTTGRSDTLLLETIRDLDYDGIEDWSDSLRIPLCLEIGWTGDSDMPMSDFVGYWNDTLRTFFSIGGFESMKRKDERTLSGFRVDRDEIVSMAEYDYPFTVSLKDFSVNDDPPPVQYIGHTTRTLEPIKGYKMLSANDSILYTIKKGREIKIDTFYRAAGRVILILPDSTIFHTKFKNVEFKVQADNAG